MTDTSHTPQTGGLSLAEGFRQVLPEIGPALGRLTGTALRLDDIACGRHGCVLFTDDRGDVVKITGDPSEAHGWLFVQDRQRKGKEAFLAGAVHVQGIWKVTTPFPGMFGTLHPKTFGVALLERVIPGHRTHHRAGDRAALTRAVGKHIDRKRGWEPVSKIDDRLTKLKTVLQEHNGRKLVQLCKVVPPQLDELCRMLAEAAVEDVWFEDVDLHNVGWRLLPRPPSMVLYDFGRVSVPQGLRRRYVKRWREEPVFRIR